MGLRGTQLMGSIIYTLVTDKSHVLTRLLRWLCFLSGNSIVPIGDDLLHHERVQGLLCYLGLAPSSSGRHCCWWRAWGRVYLDLNQALEEMEQEEEVGKSGGDLCSTLHSTLLISRHRCNNTWIHCLAHSKCMEVPIWASQIASFTVPDGNSLDTELPVWWGKCVVQKFFTLMRFLVQCFLCFRVCYWFDRSCMLALTYSHYHAWRSCWIPDALGETDGDMPIGTGPQKRLICTWW
jgi:hypothetical protein